MIFQPQPEDCQEVEQTGGDTPSNMTHFTSISFAFNCKSTFIHNININYIISYIIQILKGHSTPVFIFYEATAVGETAHCGASLRAGGSSVMSPRTLVFFC